MITKDTCWMIRDIIRHAIGQLGNGGLPSIEDGLVVDDVYVCVYRANVFDFDLRYVPIMIEAPNAWNGGFMEIRHESRTDFPEKYVYNSSNDDIKKVLLNPISKFDFCADFDGSLFQCEVSLNGMEDLEVQSLIVHNFFQDLITDKMCVVLNFDLLVTNGLFDEDKVRKVHQYFFD